MLPLGENSFLTNLAPQCLLYILVPWALTSAWVEFSASLIWGHHICIDIYQEYPKVSRFQGPVLVLCLYQNHVSQLPWQHHSVTASASSKYDSDIELGKPVSLPYCFPHNKNRSVEFPSWKKMQGTLTTKGYLMVRGKPFKVKPLHSNWQL